MGEKAGLLKQAQETSRRAATEQVKDRDCDESRAGQQPPAIRYWLRSSFWRCSFPAFPMHGLDTLLWSQEVSVRAAGICSERPSLCTENMKGRERSKAASPPDMLQFCNGRHKWDIVFLEEDSLLQDPDLLRDWETTFSAFFSLIPSLQTPFLQPFTDGQGQIISLGAEQRHFC